MNRLLLALAVIAAPGLGGCSLGVAAANLVGAGGVMSQVNAGNSGTETITIQFTEEEIQSCLDARGIVIPQDQVQNLEDVMVACYEDGIVAGTEVSP